MVGGEDEPGDLWREGATMNGVAELVGFEAEHGESAEAPNDGGNFSKVVREKKKDAEIGQEGQIRGKG